MDYSIASATGLFNLEQLNWDAEALSVAGITTEQLPEPVSTKFYLTGLKNEYVEELGISGNTPFVVGASDGVLSNLGVNAIDPGVMAVTIGTSGAIRTVTDKPVTDPKGRIFCYALTENHWVVGGPVNNGGMTFRWVRDQLAWSEVETAKRLGIDPYDVLTKIADRVTPGAEGLIFHPYLAGERAPLWNANARGSFFGLGLHHKKEHMIRSVLEGVILNLYTVMLALQEMIGVPQKIQATGGFARSALWRQMMADIFNQEVVVPESFESSCLGAVVLGMYALGEIEDFSIMSELVGSTHAHQPIEENVAIYEDLIPIYIRLSRLLSEEYGAISSFQQKWVR
jgi:gluconokinase